mgnify:CR=1 FL=1
MDRVIQEEGSRADGLLQEEEGGGGGPAEAARQRAQGAAHHGGEGRHPGGQHHGATRAGAAHCTVAAWGAWGGGCSFGHTGLQRAARRCASRCSSSSTPTTLLHYCAQVYKRDEALEAAAMRGCAANKAAFDRYGRQVLRHNERSLLPLVREFDASGDGVLRLSEFRLLLALRFAEVGREPPAMPEATRLFKAAVRDDNGRLGIDELAKILDRLGLPPDRPDYLK